MLLWEDCGELDEGQGQDGGAEAEADVGEVLVVVVS